MYQLGRSKDDIERLFKHPKPPIRKPIVTSDELPPIRQKKEKKPTVEAKEKSAETKEESAEKKEEPIEEEPKEESDSDEEEETKEESKEEETKEEEESDEEEETKEGSAEEETKEQEEEEEESEEESEEEESEEETKEQEEEEESKEESEEEESEEESEEEESEEEESEESEEEESEEEETEEEESEEEETEEEEPEEEESKEEEPEEEEPETKEPDEFTENPEEKEEEEEPPVEAMEENPITTYDYDGESYFIDNDHFLEKTFSLDDGKYSIQLCIYNCVRSGCMPYLQYLTVYDSSRDTAVFPSAESIEIVSEDSEEDIQKKVMESFQTALFHIFPPNDPKEETDTESESADIYNPHLYKGFYLDKDENGINTLVMVYDATRIQMPLATDKEYFWITPYEALVLFQYRNVLIDTSVTLLFQTIATSSEFIDQSFYRLKRVSDGSLVPSPYILFPVSSPRPTLFSFSFFSTNAYENIVQEKEEEINLLIPTMDHPKIGNTQLFSSTPLNSNVPQIKRYAVFVDIDGMEPTFVREEDKEFLPNLYDLTQNKQFSAISFLENGKHFWAIKSPLYFSEIYDRRQQFIPITSFQEVDPESLKHFVKKEIFDDTRSNEGSWTESNEGSDGEGSNAGSGDEASNADGDEASDAESEDLESAEYKRGYEAGLQVGLKDHTIENMKQETL